MIPHIVPLVSCGRALEVLGGVFKSPREPEPGCTEYISLLSLQSLRDEQSKKNSFVSVKPGESSVEEKQKALVWL